MLDELTACPETKVFESFRLDSVNILEIRKDLGCPNHPIFIATLPKWGYQFVAKIAEQGLRKRQENAESTNNERH